MIEPEDIRIRLEITGEEHTLLLRRWRGGGAPVLYVHGATFPSALSIGYRFGDRSWADDLHDRGFDVWSFDFIGFGGSTRYRGMATPPEGRAPLGRVAEAAPQVAAAVNHIRQSRDNARVHLVAHSWGTMPAGFYAGERAETIDRIVMFGPIVRRQTKGLPDPDRIGAWRYLTIAEQLARFIEDVPPDHCPVLIEPRLDLWGPSYLASDPDAATRTPSSVKTANGPLADNIAALAGNLAYDPSRVRAPTLIVRGAWDNLCQDADAAWLIDNLGSARKADVVVPEATHLMHLEHGRAGLFAATAQWLAEAES